MQVHSVYIADIFCQSACFYCHIICRFIVNDTYYFHNLTCLRSKIADFMEHPKIAVTLTLFIPIVNPTWVGGEYPTPDKILLSAVLTNVRRKKIQSNHFLCLARSYPFMIYNILTN